jgi:hypothetical protein
MSIKFSFEGICMWNKYSQHSFICCLLHVVFLLDLLFNLEDGCDMSSEILFDFQHAIIVTGYGLGNGVVGAFISVG